MKEHKLTYNFKEDDCMKKFILSTVAMTMLLSNVAFASTRPLNTNSAKIDAASTVEQNTRIDLYTLDPYTLDPYTLDPYALDTH